MNVRGMFFMMLLNRNVHTASMEAGKAGRMHVHVQPRSEFTCHSCSLSRDCQEMNHSASRTFVECSEQPGKSYNHPVVTPSRPAVGPTWKGLPCARLTSFLSPVVWLSARSRFVIPLRPMPTPRCKFTPLRSSIWRCARLAVALPSGARGRLPAGGPRQRAKCLRATWRGLQPSRPASGTSADVLRPCNRGDAPPRAAIRLPPARKVPARHAPALHAPPLRRAARPS